MENNFIAGKLYLLKPIKIDGWYWCVFDGELYHIQDIENNFIQEKYAMVCLDELSIIDLERKSIIRFIYKEKIIKLKMMDNFFHEFKEDCEAFLNDWEMT